MYLLHEVAGMQYLLARVIASVIVSNGWNYPMLRFFVFSNPVGARMNQSQPKDQKAAIRTEIPGPGSRALRAREDAHVAPGLQGYAVMAGIVVDQARGSAVTDVDGNTLPGFHRRHQRQRARALAPDLRAARCRSRSPKVSVGSFTSRARVELAERLAAAPPAPGVHRLQLYSGGAEAVESALRLAKCHTGKYEFVSFWGGFHGKTMGALSLMGSTFKDKLGPDGAGRPPDPVRGLLPLPDRLAVSELRHRLRRGRPQAGQDGGRR